jgi:hypothetical protein
MPNYRITTKATTESARDDCLIDALEKFDIYYGVIWNLCLRPDPRGDFLGLYGKQDWAPPLPEKRINSVNV